MLSVQGSAVAEATWDSRSLVSCLPRNSVSSVFLKSHCITIYSYKYSYKCTIFYGFQVHVLYFEQAAYFLALGVIL